MGESCAECDLCTLMPDGSLFCALKETQAHGYMSCDDWMDSPDIFITIDLERTSFDEEDYW